MKRLWCASVLLLLCINIMAASINNSKEFDGTPIDFIFENSFEGFEKETFPPVGWKLEGEWFRYESGISGQGTAICSFPDNSLLTTPRLNLSGLGPQKLEFSFLESYLPSDMDAARPANYFKIYFSVDGGEKWSEIFSSEWYELNRLHKVSLDLKGRLSDDCYIQFASFIPNFSMSSATQIPGYSVIFLDDISFPKIYGSNLAPQSSLPLNPLDNETDVRNDDLELKWSEELFVTNYKLYFGTSPDQFEILDGIDVGTATNYRISGLEYGRTYYWKVVGYNDTLENEDAPVWNFRIMDDPTITSFPLFENFDEGIPENWINMTEGSTKWEATSFNPYGGTGMTVMASGYETGSKAVLQTPPIYIASPDDYKISFIWGNASSSNLVEDQNGEKANDTMSPGDLATVFFDIQENGEWRNLAMLNEEAEIKYWYSESFELDPYAGEKVSFRWRYEVYDYMASPVSLDNISLVSKTFNIKEEFLDDSKVRQSEIYDINGRRVKEMIAPGLYIINTPEGVRKVLKK